MAYYAGFSNSGATGGGPRVDFGDDNNHSRFLNVGAYDNINNIDTKDRPLKLFSSTSTAPIVVKIENLPDAKTMNQGNMVSVVIDKETGQLYQVVSPL